MDTYLGLILTQKQQLNLTPSLIQSINILRMNNADMEAMINEAFLSNPVLEYAPRVRRDNETDIDNSIENIADTPATFTDSLLEQLRYSECTSKTRGICEYLIESLDERGYLVSTPSELADALDVSEDDVLAAIRLLQSFEPAGTGASSLEECLWLQMKDLGLDTPAKESILMHHLKDLALENYGKLKEIYDMSEDELADLLAEIRTLEPSPCNYYESQPRTAYVIPDLILKEEDGVLKLYSNEKVTPELQLSPRYAKLDLKGLDEKDREFIRNSISKAKLLISNINYRNVTIYKTGLAIIEHQKEFFLKQDVPLRPLTLAQIAEATGVHMSTVSRTVNGKYIATPKGTFELKSFFAGKMKNGDHSPQFIKQNILTLIENEDPHKPLSDQKISDLLCADGINVARRTVAKYRDALHIYSSRERKR